MGGSPRSGEARRLAYTISGRCAWLHQMVRMCARKMGGQG